MADETLAERLEVARQVTEMYRRERTVYLAVTLIALGMLLLCAARILLRESAGVVEIGALFGSSGALTYCTAQLLQMWNKTMEIVMGAK